MNSTMYTQHFHGVEMQGKSNVTFISTLLPQSKQRKLPKIHLPIEPSSKKEENYVVEEVDFLCGLVSSNEKKRTDMKLENAFMKQEIADMKLENAFMKQEIVDMKLENAFMKQEIADMKLENAFMKQEIADMKLENAFMKQEIVDMKQKIADMKL